jgi:N-acetylglucosaminyldiphosphoundecaprenol N-acetyl-beta-D-mannosaminyltransferase
MGAPFARVALCGMDLACIQSAELLDHMFAELGSGRGGWVITANLDFLRRHVRDPAARAVYAGADVRVADGMPLVWASKLRGTPLPERVAGSSLVLPLCQRAGREGRSVYLLGGEPEANAVAAARLLEECPGLVIAGQSSPRISAEPTAAEIEQLRTELLAARPAFVLVAFGSPKQERVIAELKRVLPDAWWLGVGISLSFLSGHVKRAPVLVQRLGLEWVHRLVQEPRRLFRRYIVEDLPFAFELLGRVLLERLTGSRGAP